MRLNFITNEEFKRLEELRMEDKLSYKEFFKPGLAYYCPWYYDPSIPDDDERQSGRRAKGLEGKTFLSVHYWRDWSHIRSPIMIICPNGAHWCPDQKSNNGDGWTVTGDVPNITANPSILITATERYKAYHGWLRDGVLTPDIDGNSYE